MTGHETVAFYSFSWRLPADNWTRNYCCLQINGLETVVVDCWVSWRLPANNWTRNLLQTVGFLGVCLQIIGLETFVDCRVSWQLYANNWTRNCCCRL